MFINEEVRRKRQHIIFFAMLQLMVFITPTVVKFVHHHEFERAVFLQTIKKVLEKEKEQCPICHFEFVNFISDFCDKQNFDSQNIDLILSLGQTSQLLNTPLQFFSNRAPPSTIA